MSNATYAIQFDGSLVDGAEIKAVKRQLSQLLRVEGDAIERLFSGRPVTLKSGLDRQQALMYQQRLQQVGARVRAVPRLPAGNRHAVDDLASSEAACPRCAYVQPRVERCARCRMDLRRHLPRRVR